VVGGVLGAFVIMMLVIATVPLFHRTSEIRNRTLIIEDALRKLSEGKALDRAVFAKVLADIRRIDEESKIVAVIKKPKLGWPKLGS
jgi:hypothetical protein